MLLQFVYNYVSVTFFVLISCTLFVSMFFFVILQHIALN